MSDRIPSIYLKVRLKNLADDLQCSSLRRYFMDSASMEYKNNLTSRCAQNTYLDTLVHDKQKVI